MGNAVAKETHEYTDVTQVQSNTPLDLRHPSRSGPSTQPHTRLVRESHPHPHTMDPTNMDPYTNPCFCTRSNHGITLELHQALGSMVAPMVSATSEPACYLSRPQVSNSTRTRDLTHPRDLTDPHPTTSSFTLPSHLPQLLFYCGCMGSGKSTKLIIDLGTYERHHARSCVIKPALDTRCDMVQSRIPSLSRKVDVLLSPQDDLDPTLTSRYTRIFVDEAQFLTAKQVAQLWSMSLFVPVVAYGLKTDFQGHFFEGSQRLMELADRVIWMPSICTRCGCDAVWNVRLSQSQPIFHGDIIQVGSDESYEARCKRCVSLSLLSGYESPPTTL